MSWKTIGQPTVRRQRDKWVVRIDGIDTTTGKTSTATARYIRIAAVRTRRRSRPSR